ncbi:MAG: amidohydrolase [Rhodobacteraceae bacterium]|nr:MAG: amidohydrolase [Paracoccaceae bacterium]
MATINRFADLHDDITAWRRDLHEHPELLFDTHRTSGVVAAKLKEFGCDEVVEGIGRTGVVGVIHGKTNKSGKVIALRADMDALPIHETTGVEHSSKTDGKMHACGHDGHTAMLLGAATYLAETRNFDGTVVVIFQPAEEGGGGGKEMVDDGMMDRFNVQEVYGMHNMPGLKVGEFATRVGPLMAATDEFTLHVEGLGGHAANPAACIDTTVVASHIVVALQTIVSRNTDPLESVVVSVTSFETESKAYNVIPQRVEIRGTVRTLTPEARDMAEAAVSRIVENTAAAYGASAKVKYKRGYPVTKNHADQTAFAASIAREISGDAMVHDDTDPVMGGEDFSYMLESRPGAFVFVGNGDTATLHHPDYDFNDDLIPVGCSYWAKLVETAMPA